MSDDTTALNMVNRLKPSKKLHDEVSENLTPRYQISGKSMQQWHEHFRVQVPADLNPRTAQELDMKLITLYQEAAQHKAIAQSNLLFVQGSTNTAYRKEFSGIVEDCIKSGTKLPAKDTLSTLAENIIGVEKDSIIHYEIEVNFWKEIIATLQECRKLIENATLNLSVEVKALNNERYLDSLNHRKD